MTEAPATATAAPTQGATGPASLEALDSVEAGVEVEVTWTGPNADGDYVTIVAAGTTEWTNEDYFYTTEGSPARLTVPSDDGAYELWYVSGADETILARRPLTVTPFAGDLLGPEEVLANTQFEVAWNGPNGPGDYVTIVAEGADRWTNESYFYTTVGSPGTLLAPLEAGAYELWYVIGSDSSIQARRPITVTTASATLEGPASVERGEQFEVTWTGPNGPGDFVTIVPEGADASAYLSYFYTTVGSPGTLTAPDEAGDYELRYIPGAADVVMASVPVEVK
jgi:Ca-activated chloride channel family protein